MSIKEIVNELNESNSSNYKLEVLEKYSDNELLKRVLKMTYDKVSYNYGITLKKIPEVQPSEDPYMNLEQALDIIESNFCTRAVTGNAAISSLTAILQSLNADDQYVAKGVIDRSQKINMGRSGINKVFPKLIIKPPYMRCQVYSKKTSKNISFPACLQLKADGRFVAITVDNGEVTFASRQGEEQEFPLLLNAFSKAPDGVYIGEMMVMGEKVRTTANGMINSSNPPHELIYVQLWDFITLEEYSRPKDKKWKVPYVTRLLRLTEITDKLNPIRVQLIETWEVNSLKEALKKVSEWMTEGYEGGVLKDYSNIFIDHDSPTQLKLKLEVECDMRITGFTVGTGKNLEYFGAVTFENDEGTIKGKVGVSSMTEKLRNYIHENREDFLSRIMEVQFNDLSKAEGNDYYALSHPRYVEIKDKDETDTLTKVFENREMALTISEEM